MCGRATLAIVPSRVCMIVASMMDSVIIGRLSGRFMTVWSMIPCSPSKKLSGNQQLFWIDLRSHSFSPTPPPRL